MSGRRGESLRGLEEEETAGVSRCRVLPDRQSIRIVELFEHGYASCYKSLFLSG